MPATSMARTCCSTAGRLAAFSDRHPWRTTGTRHHNGDKASMSHLHIGIVGGGVGGMAAAIALRRRGHRVTVYEQAGQFARVGADINLTPNAVRALDGL
ncbi:MAG: NAD(P)-binding protein, partial [Rhodoferax sp.]|nr:NAD(P)-binding protein [Rhodoferax sp.]